MGLLCVMGIYKTVKLITGNFLLSCNSTIFAIFVPSLVYRWQECAEYNLMLAALTWTIFYWLKLLKEVRIRNISLFILFCCISVYSQYGATFPVLAMALSAIYSVFKEKKMIFILLIQYIAALFIAGIPLYFFFIRKQIPHHTANTSVSSITISFSDFFDSIQTVFEVNFSVYFNLIAWIIIIILAIINCYVFLKGEKIYRIIIIMNMLTWLGYYFAVKLNIYTDAFGNRYNLFFIPIWIISIFLVDYEFCTVVSKKSFLNKIKIDKMIYIGTSCVVICYCIISWTFAIRNNWVKEDIRGVVSAWYQNEAYEKATFVHYGADSGFAYYIEHSEDYIITDENVYYMPWNITANKEEYKKYIDSIWTKKWPSEIYLVGSHYIDSEFDVLKQIFSEQGYASKTVFDKDGGILIKYTLDAQESE